MKNASLESMRQMKLKGMADAYEAVLVLPVNQHPEAHEMLATLVDAEQIYRAHKKMELFLRLSKMRYRATLTDIDCSPDRNLTKQLLMQLADGSYIHRGENILVTGATGCGNVNYMIM